MAWTERYVDAAAAGGGDGTTTATSGANGAWTFAEMLTNAASGQRVNVKAGTYSRTTSNDAFTNAGTTSAPIWIRGYNTTAGDIDTNFSLTPPAVTYTTGQFRPNKSHFITSNFSFTGALTTGGVIYPAQAGGLGGTFLHHFDNVSVENTAAAAGAAAVFSDNSSSTVWTRCRFKATATATAIYDASGQTSQPSHKFAGCVWTGGGNGIQIAGGGVANVGLCWLFYKCCFRAVGGIGISDGGVACLHAVISCSFKSAGSDSYRCTVTKTIMPVLFVDNVFGDSGGWGAQQNTGTANDHFVRVCNYEFNNTSGGENGFGDVPSLSLQTDSSDKFTSSTDLTLVSTAAGRAKGLPNPGTFNGETFSSYADIGAVQHQDAGGSAGMLFIPNLEGV